MLNKLWLSELSGPAFDIRLKATSFILLYNNWLEKNQIMLIRFFKVLIKGFYNNKKSPKLIWFLKKIFNLNNKIFFSHSYWLLSHPWRSFCSFLEIATAIKILNGFAPPWPKYWPFKSVLWSTDHWTILLPTLKFLYLRVQIFFW